MIFKYKIQVGNGFSRILQMLNVDLKKPFDHHHQNDIEEVAKSQAESKKIPNGVMLPKIDRDKKNKSKEKNQDNIHNISLENEDSQRPKIVKIYKKKNQS